MSEFNDPQSRNEAILQNMLGANNVIKPPFSRIEVLLIELLEELEHGGEVTPSAVSNAIHTMTSEQTEQALNDLNGVSSDVVPKPTVSNEGHLLTAAEDGTASWEPLWYKMTPTGATPTISPLKQYIYTCGTLTSLTVTDPPSTGEYIIEFDSGATPTVTTFPASIIGLEDFAAEANTHYEINVRNGYALVGSWAVSSS